MPDYDRAALLRELSRDEGRRAFAYKDTEGILTIGVGHNLEANGLPDEIIDDLLEYDIREIAEPALNRLYPSWRYLSDKRQRVLLNMAFNLGQDRLMQFRKMWTAIELEDFEDAAREMLDSRWARQVGVRADRLSEMMRVG